MSSSRVFWTLGYFSIKFSISSRTWSSASVANFLFLPGIKIFQIVFSFFFISMRVSSPSDSVYPSNFSLNFFSHHFSSSHCLVSHLLSLYFSSNSSWGDNYSLVYELDSLVEEFFQTILCWCLSVLKSPNLLVFVWLK